MPKYKANLGPYYHRYNNEFKISKEDYSLIVKAFFRVLILRVIRFGEIYRLPEKLGVLGVFKSPTLYPAYDYGHYRKTGEKIFLLNKHSEGQYARFCLFNQPSVTGSYDASDLTSLYAYVPAREVKKLLTREIRDNNTINNYTDLDDVRIYFR